MNWSVSTIHLLPNNSLWHLLHNSRKKAKKGAHVSRGRQRERDLHGPAPGGRDPNEVLVGRGQLAFLQAQVRLDDAGFDQFSKFSVDELGNLCFSISSSVRGKLTTIVSPLSGVMGSLVAPPTLASRGACASEFSV